jgi:hypothetical protein
MGEDDLSREFAKRRARLESLLAEIRPPIDAGAQALSERLQSDQQLIDDICEQIETALHVSLPLDARAQLMAAATAVRFWRWADAQARKPSEARIRTRRFFTFVVMAYEIATGWRAGVTWNEPAGAFEGQFFEMAKICSLAMLPEKLRPESNIALGLVLKRAGKRRTADQARRKSSGRRPKR